ncbi:hypothetical protein B9T24_07020 [Acinetobacter sp. ANC 4654]|nr:hypothetical protein B9T24_07020 [Acinetobacter sp. ANC 4654]
MKDVKNRGIDLGFFVSLYKPLPFKKGAWAGLVYVYFLSRYWIVEIFNPPFSKRNFFPFKNEEGIKF